MKRFILLLAVPVFIIGSCTEKQYVTGSDVSLSFSVDTVHFDTVFTTIGSSTKEIRVVNKNNRWIKLDRIELADNNSAFRLNIDGITGNTRSDIEIAPGDSLYIFVDVIIDPNNLNNPIAISDSIVFSFNNKLQDIDLLAWGQDINLINSEEISSETWSDEKPYVIYNSMLVDTGEVLTIKDGVRVLFHRGSTMYIAGSLVVEGSIVSRVLFSSDRLEEMYDDIPGQWNGLYFLNGSSNNSIDYADITNAVSAIHLGNLDSPDNPPDIKITNTSILHNSVTGISSLGARIEANNCIITHCGFYSLYLALGGSYDFTHCSINNYWDYNLRIAPGIYLSDYFEFNNSVYNGVVSNTRFSNSTLTGSLGNEIGIYSYYGDVLDIQFNNCALTINEAMDIWQIYPYTGSFICSDPGYISIPDYDLRPDTLSLLIDSADPTFSIPVDLDFRGFSRFEDIGPDIGAYERQIGEIHSR